jgi:cell division protein FtsQ
VKAVIPTGSTDVLVHFGDSNFLEEYRHFREHLAEWKQQYPKLISADMRYDRQVVLDTGSAVTPVIPPGAEIPKGPAKTPAGKLAKAAGAKAPVAPVHAVHAAPVNPAAHGSSAANAKMFAALAAARKQQTQRPGQGPR